MADIFARSALAVAGSTALSILLKATAVAVLVLAACRLARTARASIRHLVVASGFGVLLALPVVQLALPPVRVAIPVAETPAREVEVAMVAYRNAAAPLMMPIDGRRPVTPTAPPAWPALEAAWALGVLLFMAPVVVTVVRLRRLHRAAVPWHEGRRLVRPLAARAGIDRRVDLLLHDRLSAPIAVGFIRPAILLPSEATDWSEADVERALIHELEHVHRADWPVRVAARIACALYWFHPLAWTMWRRLCLESERACDDAVVRGGWRAAYAEQLVTLAEQTSVAIADPVLAMASRRDLSARIRAILDGRQPRGRAGLARIVAVAAAATVIAFGISPLRAAPQTPQPQASPSSGPAFEVASIKPNKSGDGRVMMGIQPGGRFTATNITLRMLIRNAYQLQDFQISGGPGWVGSDRFDVIAKAEDGALADPFAMQQQAQQGPTRLQLMLRALLAERFKLAVHTESKELPIYALVAARTDGRLGPDLKRSEVDCAALGRGRGRGAAPPEPPAGGPPQTADRMQCGIRIGPGTMSVGGASLSQLANSLSMFVGRTVVDKTGMTGTFDFNLTWTPDQMPQRPPGAPDLPPIDPNGPSIFTALQEQLGLKLDSQKGPVETLAIDRVEHPTEE